jgi:transposase
MREMSVAEQRYKAVLAVIGDGRTVTEIARDWGVSRKTLHAWLARYEIAGLEGLNDLSHCPHQMPASVEARVLEMRRAKPFWGARRLAFELLRKGEESAVYRCLVRAGVIEPEQRRRRRENWKRWERGTPMELWQLDTVGGFLLADGTSAKALTGVDDHSRYCVSARLMARERTQAGTPESRFRAGDGKVNRQLTPRPERNGEQWVCRKVASNGIVSVGYQQVSVGKNYSGSACDVLVTDGLLSSGSAASCSKRSLAGTPVRPARCTPTAQRRGDKLNGSVTHQPN